MKQNKKIILYISSIIIIILVLIGFTYGYYMTNITGNTNAKSIEVQAGNSTATYTDLSSSDINEIIEPGYTYTKLFTVQNTGNIKATYSIYLMDVINEFIRTEDITYTLYRNTGNNTINTENLADYLVVKTGTFPKTDALVIADEEITNPNDYYTYALKIDYVNLSNIDQSDDMDHIFAGNVQIYGDANHLNPYSEDTLAYNIINNSLNSTSGTKYKSTTLTKAAETASLSTENELSFAEDDLGVSYYFRGNVTNNYLSYSGMCWRIVRIEGDGSVKLIIADPTQTCSTSMETNSAILGSSDFGYTTATGSYKLGDYLNTEGRTTSLKYKLDSWLNTSSLDQTKLKNDDWCIEDHTTVYDYDGTVPLTSSEKQERINNSDTIYYKANKRITFTTKTPSLKCEGTKSKNKIGALTVDEAAFAGSVYAEDSTNYLSNNVTSNYWWTMSFSDFDSDMGDYAYCISNEGEIYNYEQGVGGTISFRGVVTLISNVSSTGTGTINDPYVIN